MAYRTRIYYTEAQKGQMWDRWQRGETLHEIARLFDRGHSSIQRILAETGGIRPRERSRSARALTLAERETISRGIVADQSIRSIARSLSRARPLSVARFSATAAVVGTGLTEQIRWPGTGHSALSPVNWSPTVH